MDDFAWKLGKWLLWLVVLVLAYIGYCNADGRLFRPVLEFGTRSQGFVTHTTTQQSYKPGDTVWAQVKFHKTRNITGYIQWHLTNSYLRTYKSREGSLPVGVWDKVVIVEKLPDDCRPGTHWFCGLVSYKVHPFVATPLEYPVWTNPFDVEVKP